MRKKHQEKGEEIRLNSKLASNLWLDYFHVKKMAHVFTNVAEYQHKLKQHFGHFIWEKRNE